MALLTKKERKHLPVWDDPSEVLYHRVKIDTDSCDGCGWCVKACPADTLELFGESPDALKSRVKNDPITNCVSCNNCLAICSTKAIEASQPYDFVGYYKQLGRGEFSLPRRF